MIERFEELKSLLDSDAADLFESSNNLATILTFMFGCAVRERKARIKEIEKAGVNFGDRMVEDEKAIIRDFSRVAALCETKSENELRQWLELIKSGECKTLKNIFDE